MAIPAELQAVNMTGVYERFGNYAPALAKYFDPVGALGPSNAISYDILDYRKAMSNLTAYGAAAPSGKMPSRATVNYQAVTTKEKIALPVELLRNIREPGTVATVNAQAQIARAILQTRMNIERRVDFLRGQWLTAGALLSSAGVFPNTAEVSGTGTAYLDFPPLSNTTPVGVNLYYTSTHLDGAVAASWETTTTDIKADLDAARRVIIRDSGVMGPWVVICNSSTFDYILKNDYVQASIAATNQIVAQGQLQTVWGYNFDVIDDEVPFSSETMATDTGGVLSTPVIPDKLVILTTANNVAAGRVLRECAPDDQRADAGARGLFAWSDEANEHPHDISAGFTYTFGLEYGNPDAAYIFADVTSTT